MPQAYEVDIHWTEKFAWWPVHSTWSKKRIWLKKYHIGEIFYDAMGRPPINHQSWKLIYTQNEYLLYLLRGDKPDVQGAHTPKYPKTRWMMME
tara:strand:+ start:1515 stop:1793 length:279 start_codon:yes stop_codon:yes gene_type:complete